MFRSFAYPPDDIRLYNHAQAQPNIHAKTRIATRVPTKPPTVSCSGTRDATSAPKNWALKRNRKASRETIARR
jgi:hypothetical protein